MSTNPQNQKQGTSPQARGAKQTKGNPNAGSYRDSDKEKRIRTEENNPGNERSVLEHGGTPGDEGVADLTLGQPLGRETDTKEKGNARKGQ